MEIFDPITKKHVLRALKEIKKNDFPNKRARSTVYDLIHDNEPFPPKEVLSIAHEIATGVYLDKVSFDGGRPIHGVFDE